MKILVISPTRIIRSFRLALCALLLVAISLQSIIQSVVPAYAAVSVTVDMSNFGGAPTYRASGFIYGLSKDASTPAQSLLSQIKVKNMRAGGSRIDCPNGGFVNNDFTPRWNNVLAYYARAKAIGSHLNLLMADLWGADAVCNVPSYPGDNGSWTQYTNFVNQVISSVKSAGMTGSDVQWDIWNEPDGIFFGGRSETQYLAMWKLGFQTIRAALPTAVITGPSSASQPNSGNAWWNSYLDYIKANNVIPNFLGWHDEGGGNDPVGDANNLNGMLSSRGMSIPAYQVNEYGTSGNEQQPGPSAWYIARFERANGGIDAARGNWGGNGTPNLYDTMGALVTANADQTMGQWWVYKRYADQTGLRTSITPSSTFDGTVFQDSSAKKSIALLGDKAGGATGSVNVVYNNIPSYLVSGGQTQVLLERMPSTNAFVSAPTVVSNSAVTVSGNSITVAINWTSALDAYAITLTPLTGGGGTEFKISNRNSSKCLDVFQSGTADGTNVDQWTCNGGTNQNWQFVASGSFFNIVSQSSGKCLDVFQNSTADGANVDQWTCNGGTNQQWTWQAHGSFFQVVGRQSGKCLDVFQSGTADGANVDIWTCTSSANQDWSRQ